MSTTRRWPPGSPADEVAELLRERIVEGRLAPNAPLTQGRLAEDLNVTRTVVGEALRVLHREGLVHTTRAGGAMRVSAPDHALLVAAHIVREALDGLAARLAADHAGPGTERRCHAAIREQRAALESGDRRRGMRADVSFHAALGDGSGNPVLCDHLRAVRGASRSAMLLGPAHMRQAAEQHAAILAAVRADDGDTAEHAARVHVRATLAALRRLPGERQAPP